MPNSLEFILGVLDQTDPAHVACEDLDGPHGPALRLWQRHGWLNRAPGVHPVPSCPHCPDGVPYAVAGRHLCHRCRSPVDRRHLLLWRFRLEALLDWLARTLRLTGGVRPIDESLWQLGRLTRGDTAYECFFQRSRPLAERGRARLLAFRSALLLGVLPQQKRVAGFAGPCLSLVELLRQDRRTLHVADLGPLLGGGRVIRFDRESGGLFAADVWLGEVPIGTKEYHLLARLWNDVDRYVAYGDLKAYVLRQAGSKDGTDEATFCHKLKGRIKEKGWVPKIDVLIATTNKGDGYRLRGHLGERWLGGDIGLLATARFPK